MDDAWWDRGDRERVCVSAIGVWMRELEIRYEEGEFDNIEEYLVSYSQLNGERDDRERCDRAEIKRILERTNEEGETLLTRFSKIGNKEIVSDLLSLGANIESDSYGWTSLTFASYYGHQEVVSILLEYGAHVAQDTLIRTSSPEILFLLSSYQRWIERRNFLTFLNSRITLNLNSIS